MMNLILLFRILSTFSLIISSLVWIAVNEAKVKHFIYRCYVKCKRIPTTYEGFKVGDRVKYRNVRYYEDYKVVRITAFRIDEDKYISRIYFSDGADCYPDYIDIRKAPTTKEHLPEWF